MNILVCIKRVPKTAEADLFIDREGRDIKKEDLVFALNDWDGYAVREAVRLREEGEGTVTVFTIGPEESKEVLTRCLAMGADKAVRIEPPEYADANRISDILFHALRNELFDLVLTGVQAEDDGWGQVGVALAGRLGLPHASIVNRIEIRDRRALVKRELEGGIEELVELNLPAVLTIQTGINEPKYVSLSAILEAEDKEMKEFSLEEIGFAGAESLAVTLEQVFFPPAGRMAEMLKGNPDEIVVQLTEIIKKKKG